MFICTSPDFNQQLPCDEVSPPPFLQLASLGGIAAIFLKEPENYAFATRVVVSLGRSFFSYGERVREQVSHLIPPLAQRYIGTASENIAVAAKVARHGVIMLGELADKVMPTLDATAETSIELAMNRMSAHNLDLARCVNFIGDEIVKASSDAILQLMEERKEIGALYDPLSDLQDTFLSWNRELIGQTVKANVMHLAANLTEQVYEEGYEFKDGRRNPIGRWLSLLFRVFQSYETRLGKADALEHNEKANACKQIFKELSSALLAKCFPKGMYDLQFYHPVLPGMHLVKEYIWERIESNLPALLEQLYRETKSLRGDLKEQFNAQTVNECEVGVLMNIPSLLVESKIRKNQGKDFNSLFPKIEMALKDKGYSNQAANDLSRHLTRYLKEFFLTQDPSLLKAGAFLENYFTERLLLNFTHFNPSDESSEMEVLFTSKVQSFFGRLLDAQVVETIFSRLSGAEMESGKAQEIIKSFITCFDPERDDFPLPPVLKELVWSSIQETLITKGGGAITDAIPKWDGLINQNENVAWLNEKFGDSLFTESVSGLAQKWSGDFFEKLRSSDNPFIGLFLNALNQRLETEQEIRKRCAGCLHALALQVSKDLYTGYELSLIARAEGEGSSRLSFPGWLIQNIIDACSGVSTEKLTRAEVADLNNAFRLKREFLQETDPVEKKNKEVAFNHAWKKIKPKFDAALFRLLHAFSYKTASDLPFPPPLQILIWDVIVDNVPRLLFDEMGEVIQLSLQKEKLKREATSLPGGDCMAEGCHLLALDITHHLPKWIEGYLNRLPETLSETIPELRLSNHAWDHLVETLKGIAGGEGSYSPIMQGVQIYLEALFLKVVLNAGKMEPRDWSRLHLVVEEARVPPDEEGNSRDANLEVLGGRLLDWAGIEAPHHLFGLPESLQTLLYNKIKQKLAEGVLELDSMSQRLHSAAVDENVLETYLPQSGVDQSLLSITRYILDRATDQLSEQGDGGMKGVSQLYTLLNPLLAEKEEEGYRSAAFLKGMIAGGAPTPLIERMLAFLDSSATQPYRETIAGGINPILTGYASRHLSKLLQKEREGEAEFDQSLLMAVLPILSRHLECLNQAAHLEGGLSSENYAKVAGEDHYGEAAHFYRNQAKILFQLIFPQGVADLKQAIPRLEIADETFELIQEKVESVVAAQLPTVIETLFDREILLFIFSNILENVIEALHAPIVIPPPREIKQVSNEEASQKEMDEEVGKLILQAALFINLPSQLFKGISYESIGASIREKFNGRLFHDILPLALEKMKAKKHERKSAEERRDEAVQNEKNLKRLQWELASSGIAYLFNYLGAQIDHATDIFLDPKAKMCRDAIVSVSRFILVDVIGGLLRIFRVDQAAVYLLNRYLDHTVEKSLGVFAQPKLQENFVYRSVEAIEEVLMQ